MASQLPARKKRLRDAGLLKKNVTLPPEYDALIEGLTPEELEVLIAVRARLDEAERVSTTEAVHFMMPP
jgi:hypothetical protein